MEFSITNDPPQYTPIVLQIRLLTRSEAMELHSVLRRGIVQRLKVKSPVSSDMMNLFTALCGELEMAVDLHTGR